MSKRVCARGGSVCVCVCGCPTRVCVCRYVSSLSTLCEVFVKPLCDRGAALPTAVEELFRNVQIILGLNRKFLHELHRRMESWSYQQKVGDVFLHFSPFMKMVLLLRRFASRVCVCCVYFALRFVLRRSKIGHCFR